jgi:uncharacterized protein (TIGR01777 family)
MKLAVSGASGLVGSALLPALRADGHAVARLVRPGAAPRSEPAAAGADDIRCDIAGNLIDAAALEGVDAVVHLAGVGIAAARWTPRHLDAVRASRVDGTRRLATTLARLARPPRVLVQASAVGFYGDRGDEILTEASAPGQGFLAETCVAWEAAAAPLRDRGVRVVALRFGVILSARGGALAKMLLPFRLGLGGVIGSGRQWMPWLGLDDAVGMIRRALDDASLDGAVNAVAPEQVTNRQFTATLGRALGRPTILPVPAFAARLALGRMADALLLASVRVTPRRLTAAGYPYIYGALRPALEAALRER